MHLHFPNHAVSLRSRCPTFSRPGDAIDPHLRGPENRCQCQLLNVVHLLNRFGSNTKDGFGRRCLRIRSNSTRSSKNDLSDVWPSRILSECLRIFGIWKNAATDCIVFTMFLFATFAREEESLGFASGAVTAQFVDEKLHGARLPAFNSNWPKRPGLLVSTSARSAFASSFSNASIPSHLIALCHVRTLHRHKAEFVPSVATSLHLLSYVISGNLH